MHIRQNRNLQLVLNFLQNAQAFLQSRAAKAANRSAIGLVVAGLEDERETERLGHALDNLGHANGVLFALDHARPGNQKKIARSDANIADLEGGNQGALPTEIANQFTTETQRHREIHVIRFVFSVLSVTLW